MKKGFSFFVAACSSLFLLGSGWSACSEGTNVGGNGTDTTTDTASVQPMAQASITGVYQDTVVVGTARFMQQEDGEVRMVLEMNIPTKAGQEVAVHIHENGDCGDSAKNAGGHWNPTNTQHGKWGSASFHSGDIGNISLNASGHGTMEMETALWSIGGSEQTNILNKTIVVHGGVDDFTTQPAGASGNRIACGVINRMNGNGNNNNQ